MASDGEVLLVGWSLLRVGVRIGRLARSGGMCHRCVCRCLWVGAVLLGSEIWPMRMWRWLDVVSVVRVSWDVVL